MKQLPLTTALIFWVFCASAQVRHEMFESFSLQEQRQIQVYTPEDYNPEKTYPLVLVLDAERLFDQVVALSKYYNKFQGMPQTLVVGVNQEANQLRWEDCAFDPETGMPTSKGSQFHDFIALELLPSMEKTYSLAPFKMFVGYDITANFGNYFLISDHSPFNAYVHLSPRQAPGLESDLRSRLQNPEKTIFYHLIAGEQRGENKEQIRNLNATLGSIAASDWHYFYDSYSGIDGVSTVSYGLGKAWDRTFNIFKPISPEEYREKILPSEQPVFAYLEKKMETIEKLFGYRIDPSLSDVIAIYAGARKKQDYESLKPLADLCKSEFPDTMLGFYFEGEYYEYTGDPKKALRSFEKAFGMQEIDFLTREMALNKMDALKTDFGF
jgi:predicted alpha/beta superfamily hydrolase